MNPPADTRPGDDTVTPDAPLPTDDAGDETAGPDTTPPDDTGSGDAGGDDAGGDDAGGDDAGGDDAGGDDTGAGDVGPPIDADEGDTVRPPDSGADVDDEDASSPVDSEDDTTLGPVACTPATAGTVCPAGSPCVGRNDRNRWTTAYDLSACSACPLQTSVWVRGSTERNYDYVQLECSGNGGSSWTAMGDPITGGYSGWTQITRAVPSACMTDRTAFAMRFVSDFSWSDQGYLVDDFRLHTTAQSPKGNFDGATPTSLWGWTCDADAWSDELRVRLDFQRGGAGPVESRWARASTLREDLITAGVCGGTGNHGFEFVYDEALLTWLGAGTHTVRAWAIDGPGPCGAGAYLLNGSPHSFTR